VSPIFSPDGEQIAFLSKRGDEYGIWARATLGGPLTFLGKVNEGIKEILKWSQDGRLFIASRNAVFSLDLETKNTEKLLELSYLPETSFAIAPGSDRIGYIDVQNGQSDIWIVTIGSSRTTRVTDDEFKEGDLVWYPDGNRIIYDSVRNGISQIYVCGLNGDSPGPPFTSNVSLYISDVSPDGKEILYYSQRDDADLWNVRIDNKREARLTDSVAMEMWARESRDGLRIVYQQARTDDPSLRIVKSAVISESLTPERTTQELTSDGYLPSWSPDGKRIAFLRSSDGQANLWTISSEMGQESPLTERGITFGGLSPFPYNRLQTQDYQWSQGGESIVYCARRGGISNVWQANSDGSGETQLTDNDIPGPWFFCPLISPSGDRIAFVRLDLRDEKSGINRWSIWLYEASGTRKIFESSALLGIVGWSSDGELIAKSTIAATSETVLPSTVGLLGISTDQRPPRLLNRLTDAYSKNIILSPDTKLLAYVKRNDGMDSIHVVSTHGGEDQTILTSNDGRFILVV
jgi:Tol biopolymer transport system component